MTSKIIKTKKAVASNSGRALPDQGMNIGLDLGMGAIKIFSDEGGLEFSSFVAVGGGTQIAKMMGISQQEPAMQVQVGSQSYYVGQNAHDNGRAIESFDYERLTGSPEIQALFYGSLTAYITQYGEITLPVTILAGLPLEMLSEDNAKINAAEVKKWLKGEHSWIADGQEYQVHVVEVKVTSQPAGALFDFLLDDEGQFISDRKSLAKKELGIVSIGFNTMELLTVRNKAVVQRLSMGSTVGVRRLLELLNQDGNYTLGELDTYLRSGNLELDTALPIWEREISGQIEKRWGKQWERYERVIIVGGGAMLLGNRLMTRFNGKAHLPDQPILSIARGLYKQLKMGSKRGK